MVNEITNVDDIRIDIGGTVQVPVSDFEISREEGVELAHGAGSQEPRGVTRGNISYSGSFTVEGETPDVFLDTVEAADQGRSAEIKFVATGPHFKYTVIGVFLNNETYGGSAGDAVEFSAEFVATGLERENLGGTDL